MAKLMIVLIKNTIKVTLEMYGVDIIIAIFAIVELATCTIVMWETITGKNLVDVIFGWFGK